MTVRDDIYELFESWDLELFDDLDDQTSLFDTGLLDSIALFSLLLWVEEQVGHSIDPGSHDLRREWCSIDAIVRFIEGNKTEPASGSNDEGLAQASPAGDHGIQFVRCDPAFRSQIAELQTGLWSRDADLNARYFEWLYECNPYVGKLPAVFLALEGEELIGMRGFFASQWEIGGRVTPVLVADDLMIRPDRRNRGVHQRLMEFAFADLLGGEYMHAFNLSGSPINVLCSLTMGWQRTGLLEMMGTRESGSGAFGRLRAIVQKTPFVWRYAESPWLHSATERRPFRLFDHVGSRVRRTADGLRFSAEARESAMAELVKRRPCDGRIRHVRDEAYLTWRYRNPLFEYRFIYAGEEQLDGYLALSQPVKSTLVSKRVRIVDIEAVSIEVYRRLLKAAIGQFDELVTWTATLAPDEELALHDAGFASIDTDRRARGVPAILVRSLTGDDDWSLHGTLLTDLRQWDMRMLYSMSG